MFLAITSMRNEGPHCLEWFAHHLAAGFDHFLVFSNDCDDGTDEILDILQTAGLVTHERLTPEANRSVQWQALRRASSHDLLRSAEWAMFFDCDEFINLRPPLSNLPGLIAALPKDTDAIALVWRLFGNSGHVEMRDVLTCEHFTMAAPTDIALPLAHFFKTLFRPGAFRQMGVHRPKRKKAKAQVWVDGCGNRLSDSLANNDQRINLFGLPHGSDLVQLNHYSLRSAESFMIKRARGLPNRRNKEVGLGYWVERNFNSVEDKSIEHMLPATREKLASLLAIDGVRDHHLQAVSHHKLSFEEMMQELKNIQLFWHLVLSGSSQPPAPAIARTQIERLTKAMQKDA